MPKNILKYYCWQFMFVFIFLMKFACAQVTGVWQFGSSSQLIFAEDFEVISSQGNIVSNEGVSCISNSLGELLFSTNGENVWNAAGEQVNLQTMLGHKSSTQSSLILPNPSTVNEFFIFTTGAIESNATSGILAISKVMIDDDEVSVDSNWEIPILPSTDDNGFSSSERLAAIEKCNGNGYWVVAHDDGRFEENNQNFYVFDVNEFGVEMMPVQSFGFNHQYGNENSVGQMKFSPDGSRLALANRGDQIIYVYEFDNATGQINEESEVSIESPLQGLYGVEFSPSSDYLYFSTSEAIFRKPFIDPDLEPELLSLTLGQAITSAIWALQMGPDYNIYVSQGDHNFIGRIVNPNEDFVEFEPDAIELAGGTYCHIGLPSFIQSYFDASIDFDINRMGCSKIVQLTPQSLNVESFLFEWEYDSQFSFDSNPIHLFSDFGNHEVLLQTTKPDGCAFEKSKTLELAACEEYYSQYDGEINSIDFEGVVYDAERRGDVVMYPNPILIDQFNQLNFRSVDRIRQVEIYDRSSTKVYSQTFNNFGSRNQQIEIEDHLSSGLYFVIVTLENSKEVSLKLTIAG